MKIYRRFVNKENNLHLQYKLRNDLLKHITTILLNKTKL